MSVWPGLLASIPSPEHGVLHLGPIPLHAYGLMLAIGIITAVRLAEPRAVARGFEPGLVNDIDPFRAWARAVVDSELDAPWVRQYAAGSAFLRGMGHGRVAALTGRPRTVRVVPFRGEYFELLPAAAHLCRNLIYPVPDPSFPFLGVHFTRMTTGKIECGPNAVLAFAREGYRKRDVNLRDLVETLTYSGFLRLAAKHWRTGCHEMWRSFSKRAFVRALKRLIPEIESEQLAAAPAGVRAQALSPDGTIVDDFSIQEFGRVVNVVNAPSPAATYPPPALKPKMVCARPVCAVTACE